MIYTVRLLSARGATKLINICLHHSYLPSTGAVGQLSSVKKMSTQENQQPDDPLAFVKKRNKSYTLFDHVPADTVNLKMGAPGEVLLKKSKEIMKKATAHKMVIKLIVN